VLFLCPEDLFQTHRAACLRFREGVLLLLAGALDATDVNVPTPGPLDRLLNPSTNPHENPHLRIARIPRIS
jgi:hypothetical protein